LFPNYKFNIGFFGYNANENKQNKERTKEQTTLQRKKNQLSQSFEDFEVLQEVKRGGKNQYMRKLQAWQKNPQYCLKNNTNLKWEIFPLKKGWEIFYPHVWYT